MAKRRDFAARLARIKKQERKARPPFPDLNDPELALPLSKEATAEPFGLLINFRLALAGMAAIGLTLYALSPANEPTVIVLAHADVAENDASLGVLERPVLAVKIKDQTADKDTSYVQELLEDHAKRTGQADNSAVVATGTGAQKPVDQGVQPAKLASRAPEQGALKALIKELVEPDDGD